MVKIGKVTVHYPESKQLMDELEERFARLYCRFLLEEITPEGVEEVLRIHEEKQKASA